MRNDFAVIIISHKRPECSTYRVLRECGYTGAIYFVVDDGDPTVADYQEIYGDSVKVFHKEVNFDTGDNFDGPNSIATFSRNYCWKVAEDNGLKTFLMLDDDLQSITYRYVKDGHLKGKKAKNIDAVFDSICEWLLSTNLGCISFGNAFDYIGGVDRMNVVKRTAMNSFFLRVDRRFDFMGRYMEDNISPVLQNKIGNIVIGYKGVHATFDVWTGGKSSDNGGCQIAYADIGSFTVRFYALLWHPDCIYLRYDGQEWKAVIRNDNAYPLILSERHRK